MEVVKTHIKVIKEVFKVVQNNIIIIGFFDNITLEKPIYIVKVIKRVVIIL